MCNLVDSFAGTLFKYCKWWWGHLANWIRTAVKYSWVKVNTPRKRDPLWTFWTMTVSPIPRFVVLQNWKGRLQCTYPALWWRRTTGGHGGFAWAENQQNLFMSLPRWLGWVAFSFWLCVARYHFTLVQGYHFIVLILPFLSLIFLGLGAYVDPV